MQKEKNLMGIGKIPDSNEIEKCKQGIQKPQVKYVAIGDLLQEENRID